MNHVLGAQGIDCLESDMGGVLHQLAGEKPSHIIMPAIHLNRQQVGTLFHEHLAEPYTTDVDELIQTGRRVLRQKFFEADIGISGVNFAVAETGTLLLVENEGNGRMSYHGTAGAHRRGPVSKRWWRTCATWYRCCPLLTRWPWAADHTYVNMISGPRARRGAGRTRRARCTWCCWTTAAARPSPTANCARPSTASAAAPA